MAPVPLPKDALVIPDSGQIISLAAIVIPLAALVAVELVRGSPGTVRRYYARFLAFGNVHGLILWALYLWGNMHSLDFLGPFLILMPLVCLIFTAGYLASALLLHYSRRLVRAVQRPG